MEESYDHLKSLEGTHLKHAFGPGANGVQLHYLRAGQGPSVVLLHGWPGFWYDWRRVLPRLAREADVIAPDFRGFGESEKPDLPPLEAYTPTIFAQDILTLLNHLNVRRVVVVAHDLGATVAQVLARLAPETIQALVLLNPPYAGVGMRRFEPSVQAELWYQHFHNLPWSDQLIGHHKETIHLYLRHFYTHWLGRQEALDAHEFETIVEMYARPGAMRASILYYRARAARRLQEATLAPETFQIPQPTTVLWGQADPVSRWEWSDRLSEYFTQFSLSFLLGVGHFVPFEAPDEVLKAIQTTLV
jgi:pimeloyl-ACP methyl ester carboxylesterase